MSDRCDGSGMRPVEMVLLDTTPGMNPRGTCPVCLAMFELAPFRLPEHERASLPPSSLGSTQ